MLHEIIGNVRKLQKLSLFLNYYIFILVSGKVVAKYGECFYAFDYRVLTIIKNMEIYVYSLVF